MATDFARYAAEGSSDSKSFQSLLFLIRDWRHLQDFGFGFDSGTRYIDGLLKNDENRKESLRSVREFIYNSFEDIRGFLMPSPGRIVETGMLANKQPYDGRWLHMDREFKKHLMNLTEFLLKPSNLKVKKIHGNELSCAQIGELLELFFDKFLSDEMPKVSSIYGLTVDRELNKLTEILARKHEVNLLENLDPTEQNFFDSLNIMHKNLTIEAITKFNNSKKIGTPEHLKKHLDNLLMNIEKNYEKIIETSAIDHEQFIQQKQKLGLAMFGKSREEAKMFQSLIDIVREITKLTFLYRHRPSEELKEKIQEVNNFKKQQETLIEDHQRERNNEETAWKQKEMEEKLAKMQLEWDVLKDALIHNRPQERSRGFFETVGGFVDGAGGLLLGSAIGFVQSFF
jgi:hypothetical protein